MSQSGDTSLEEIKVYSYNVQACDPMKDIFERCPEMNQVKKAKKMEEDRMEWINDQIIKKITYTDKHNQKKTRKNVFFCLQEVCGDMKDSLKTSLTKLGYHMIFRSSKSCEAIGEAIAYYQKKYQPCIFPYEPLLTKHKNNRKYYFLFSRMTLLKGQDKGKYFCIGSCHLPSRAITNPERQLIHAGNVVRHFQKFCDGSKGVLAGDFAMPKGKLSYNAVTTGKVNDHSEGSGYFFNTATKPMNSAYCKMKGDKPPKTLVYGEEIVDYIFCTKNIEVLKCHKLQRPSQNGSEAARTACPTKTHPSKHFIVGATLKVLLSKVPECPSGRLDDPTRNNLNG